MKKAFISPKHLKALRDRKGWPRSKLSDLSGVTERSIASYETAQAERVSLTQNSFKKLVGALGERPEVLAGEASLPAEEKPHEVTLQLNSLTRLNLDLIDKKYGFSINDIINVAPLFFVQAAEKALARQVQKLEEDKNSFLKRYRTCGDWEAALYELFGVSATDDINPGEYFEYREAAVENCDLFESGTAEELCDEPWEYPNPFAEFMNDECVTQRLASIHEDRNTVYSYFSSPEHSFPSNLRIPQYSICRDELDKITCGSTEAYWALMQGIVTVPEIPTDLWEPRNAGKRVEWLEEKYRQSVERDEKIEEE